MTTFEMIRMDYDGPVLIKSRSGRGCKISKAYVILFVYFVTVIGDRCKMPFLALKRFESRSGLPIDIHNNNETIFCDLTELTNLIHENEKGLTHCFHNNELIWLFIPSRSHHFGEKVIYKGYGLIQLTFEYFPLYKN